MYAEAPRAPEAATATAPSPNRCRTMFSAVANALTASETPAVARQLHGAP